MKQVPIDQNGNCLCTQEGCSCPLGKTDADKRCEEQELRGVGIHQFLRIETQPKYRKVSPIANVIGDVAFLLLAIAIFMLAVKGIIELFKYLFL